MDKKPFTINLKSEMKLLDIKSITELTCLGYSA